MFEAKVMIVEDDPQDATLLKNMLIEYEYSVTGIATSLAEAKQLYVATPPDIVIIDVFLRGRRDGISFALLINDREERNIPFIFLTSATDRDTFNAARNASPFGYLIKPFNELELQYAIELAIERAAGISPGAFIIPEKSSLLLHDFFFVKRGDSLAKIMLKEIQYIEVEGKYCKIVCGGEKFLIQQPLKQLLERLPAGQFIRVHRNYIINVQRVRKVNLQDNEFVLEDGNTVLYSRRYIDDFMHLFDVLK